MLIPLIYHKIVMIFGFKGTAGCPRLGFGFARRDASKGVSLLFALVFVALLGSALASIAAFNAYKVRESEAQVTALELMEIGKAARLYVRDQMITNAALRTIGANPTRISFAALRAGGYLPASFMPATSRYGAGTGRGVAGAEQTVLGQNIYIVMTNWPIPPVAGTVDPTSVPTAIVLVQDSARSDGPLVTEIVRTMRAKGATLSVPLFNGAGIDPNTADCRSSGDAVGLWDTGCLTQAEYTRLASILPGPPTFTAGSLVIPAWKIAQPDLRAMMRFPQPENPGFATMLTDLRMGRPTGDTDAAAANPDDDPCTGNHMTITTSETNVNGAATDSGLCAVVSDTGADNNRFNINNVNNMALQRLIASPQAADNTADAPSIGTGDEDAMRIIGNLTLAKDLRIYDVPGAALPTAAQNAGRPAAQQITERFRKPNGSVMVERNAYLYSLNGGASGVATVGSITNARKLVSDAVRTPTFTSANSSTYPYIAPADPRAHLSVSQAATFTGNIAMTGNGVAETAGELISEEVRALNAQINVDAPAAATGVVQVTGVLQTTNAGNTVIAGANPITDGVRNYAAVIGEVSDGGKVTSTAAIHGSNENSTIKAAQLSQPGNAALTRIDINNPAAPAGADSNIAECKTGPNVVNGCPNRQYVPPVITP
jgi:hypothetical protein